MSCMEYISAQNYGTVFPTEWLEINMIPNDIRTTRCTYKLCNRHGLSRPTFNSRGCITICVYRIVDGVVLLDRLKRMNVKSGQS